MTFKPLDPPRFEYIDAMQKPEIDYKAAYELQRITTKKTALTALWLIDALAGVAEAVPNHPDSKRAAQRLAEAKQYITQVILEHA